MQMSRKTEPAAVYELRKLPRQRRLGYKTLLYRRGGGVGGYDVPGC